MLNMLDIDEAFAIWNRLKLIDLPTALPLRLFDGSTLNSVSKKTVVPITFSMGESHIINYYVTRLDKIYAAVLGYDWLVQHNPQINWVETKVIFKHLTDRPTTPDRKPEPTGTTPKLDIQLINAKAFHKLHRQKGVMAFSARINADRKETPTTTSEPDTVEAPNTLAGIPPEYHEFSDVFSGEKADTLPPHRPYNLKITLEEGAKPSYGPIYSLSPTKLTTLHEFIDENMCNGFI